VLLLEKTSFPREKVCGDRPPARGVTVDRPGHRPPRVGPAGCTTAACRGSTDNHNMENLDCGPGPLRLPSLRVVPAAVTLRELLARNAHRYRCRLLERTFRHGGIHRRADRPGVGPCAGEPRGREPSAGDRPGAAGPGVPGVSARLAISLGTTTGRPPDGVAVRGSYQPQDCKDDYLIAPGAGG